MPTPVRSQTQDVSTDMLLLHPTIIIAVCCCYAGAQATQLWCSLASHLPVRAAFCNVSSESALRDTCLALRPATAAEPSLPGRYQAPILHRSAPYVPLTSARATCLLRFNEVDLAGTCRQLLVSLILGRPVGSSEPVAEGGIGSLLQALQPCDTALARCLVCLAVSEQVTPAPWERPCNICTSTLALHIHCSHRSNNARNSERHLA